MRFFIILIMILLTSIPLLGAKPDVSLSMNNRKDKLSMSWEQQEKIVLLGQYLSEEENSFSSMKITTFSKKDKDDALRHSRNIAIILILEGLSKDDIETKEANSKLSKTNIEIFGIKDKKKIQKFIKDNKLKTF